MTASDYCELCELPLATCVHGQPPPPPPVVQQATPRRTAAPRARATPAPAVQGPPRLKRAVALTNGTRKRTPQTEFKPYIVELLQRAGGEQHVDDLFAELEVRMEAILLPGDYETMPPQDEVRWRYNARWARKALVDEGLLMPPRRPGVWELTPAGRSATVE
ncbi:MAG: hypothetical protein JWO11_2790 [Nocardioides sp.]|nr:hypothetical protein [Nocardioides sp.]